MRGSILALGAMLGLLISVAGNCSQPVYLHAPSVNSYTDLNPEGTTTLPTGRLLRPDGKSIPVAKWPHGLAISPDGKTAYVSSGVPGEFIYNWNSANPVVKTVVPKHKSEGGSVVFSPDGKYLYRAAGDDGGIYKFDVATGAETAFFTINGSVEGKTYSNSVTQCIRISADGATLYCADVANFRLVTLNTSTGKLLGSVKVGYYPYSLAVAGNRVYVANIGMFRYHLIPKAPDGYPQRGLTHPPFGVPSRQATTGVNMEGRDVPGLNDPNIIAAYSVWGVDVSNPASLKVVQRVKTGVSVGQKVDGRRAIGGSAPNFLLAHGHTLYISDNNDDLIEQLDTQTGVIVHRSLISPSPLVAKLRGVEPAGMAISPDGSRLYIAEIGINAIGVMDTHTGDMVGQIPTAWYPYRVGISKDGSHLCVICFRGFGYGPNAGLEKPNSPFLGMMGSFTSLATPTATDLKMLTQRVMICNGFVNRIADMPLMGSPVIPTTPGVKSPDIRTVVFILKENHTYDTIFDHIPGARSDPSLLRWGLHQDISAPGEPILHDVPVMVNHNALAREFTVSDNYYMMPEMSGMGHRWLVDVKPNNWCQMLYTLGWNWIPDNSAPGRLVPFGANAGMAPEDYPEAGSMWDHLANHGITFRNYGEGFEFAGVIEDDKEAPTGARETVNIPMEKCLYDNTCFGFPLFNMNIPDQYRAHWFEKDITTNYLDKGKPMPQFLCVDLCNDHGTDPNPKRGYPYVASWMADDDLALGRIVDFLSHTPEWKHMAIFVTEDDSGGEPDHVDRCRGVELIISPWVKRHYVSHRHTTIVSMHRTMYEIFGLGPLNIDDAVSNDFSDCFTTHPDYAPYNVLAVDPQIFDPAKAIIPGDPNYADARLLPSIAMDNPITEAYVDNHSGSKPAKKREGRAN